MENIISQIQKKISECDWSYRGFNFKLYHFCSYETAFSIVGSQKFRACDILSMNDSRDGFAYFDHFTSAISNKIALFGGPLAAATDRMSDADFAISDYIKGGVKSVEEALFYILSKCFEISDWRREAGYVGEGTYISSFSSGDNVDDLYNWFAYGQHGEGVGLGFDADQFWLSVRSKSASFQVLRDGVPYTLEQPVIFKIIYLSDEEMRKGAEELVEDIISYLNVVNFIEFYSSGESSCLSNLPRYVFDLSLAIKEVSFSKENEFRIIFNMKKPENDPRIKWGISKSVAYSYIEFEWEKLSLSSVLIGPAQSDRQIFGFKKYINSLYFNPGTFFPKIKSSSIALQKRR